MPDTQKSEPLSLSMLELARYKLDDKTLLLRKLVTSCHRRIKMYRAQLAKAEPYYDHLSRITAEFRKNPNLSDADRNMLRIILNRIDQSAELDGDSEPEQESAQPQQQ